ncbi:MAG: hypothetical protein AB1750_10380 [Chloroflexota bacterium]
MQRVIHRRISTIQITSIELVWRDDDAPAPTVADLPLPAPTQAGRAAPSESARQAGPARKPRKRRAQRHVQPGARSDSGQ